MDSPPEGDDEGGEKRTPRESGDAKPDGEGKDNPRRQFLQLSLAIGVVLVMAGVASVALSLFSPSAPAPSPPPPATETSTQTVTSTETETVTSGSSGASTTSTSSSTSSSATSSASTSSTTSSPFPQILVANISALTGTNLGQTVSFNYPLEETPNLLIKLGVKAEGGVGPDGDIVAFSQVCQHLGCIWGYIATGDSPVCASSYKAPGPVGYCCCHGSQYDLANGAAVLGGPAPRPVPQVTLSYDDSSGDIYATGMGPPTIFGYHTGSNNVLYDLQGGTPV
jgi:arsenite oxidase small subunit